MNEVNKLLGAGTMMMGSDPKLEVSFIPTGVLPIDYLLDGGIPRGRFIEFYGSYSSLKSWIALRAIASCQESGGIAALIDTEHAFDPQWAIANGVDPDELLLEHPNNGEKAVDSMEMLIRAGAELIVWDSIAATLPKDEEQKSTQDSLQPARLAALMSRALRKLNAANTNTAVLCINQTRVNVGQMFGNPETTPGGKAMGFFASYRMSLSKAGKITEPAKVWDGEKFVNGKVTTHQKVKAVLEKSKLSSPHREAWFLWDYKQWGVDEVNFLVALGLEKGVVLQKGQMWSIQGSKTSHRGRAKFLGSLASNPRTKSRLRQLCLTKE
jgi:recombination protein RecA